MSTLPALLTNEVRLQQLLADLAFGVLPEQRALR